MTLSPTAPRPLVVAAQKRNRYWRGQVWPRRGEYFTRWRLGLPLVVGLGFSFLIPLVGVVDVPIKDLAGVGINYAALSFGACITGAVLAIGLPSESRVRRWASRRDPVTDLSSYSDLVFALTWSAMAQLQLLAVSILSVVVGQDVDVVPPSPWITHRVLLGVAVFSFLYAVVQLLTLVSTISQLGNLIDFDEWRSPGAETHGEGVESNVEDSPDRTNR